MPTIRLVSVSMFLSAVFAFVAVAANASVLIQVDKSSQQMIVSVDGVERHVWPVSTGRSGHDTPAGSHRAFRMERDHYSREWDDAPMPHSIFFTQRGHAIHGSNDTKRIGSPASAGCVRLSPENAATLFALVEEKGVLNTKVEIGGDVRVALARSRQRTANRTADQRRSQRRPVTIVPDEANPNSGYYTGRRARYVDPDELESYASRMRQRYQRQRTQQRYYNGEVYDGYGRPQYFVERPYEGDSYYRRRSYPYQWD